MTGKHFELTGETRNCFGHNLHRIRAARDMPRYGVRKGDVGGWVEHERNVSGYAWVAGDVRVFGDAWVSDNAEMSGNAEASVNATVSGNADVSGDARVSGRAEVYGRATVTERQDILVVDPLGSQSSAVTLTRAADGHNLSVGCWHGGTIDTLPAEVDRRSQMWPGTAQDHARWRAEYEALEALCRARIAGWQRTVGGLGSGCPV